MVSSKLVLLLAFAILICVNSTVVSQGGDVALSGALAGIESRFDDACTVVGWKGDTKTVDSRSLWTWEHNWQHFRVIAGCKTSTDGRTPPDLQVLVFEFGSLTKPVTCVLHNDEPRMKAAMLVLWQLMFDAGEESSEPENQPWLIRRNSRTRLDYRAATSFVAGEPKANNEHQVDSEQHRFWSAMERIGKHASESSDAQVSLLVDPQGEGNEAVAFVLWFKRAGELEGRHHSVAFPGQKEEHRPWAVHRWIRSGLVQGSTIGEAVPSVPGFGESLRRGDADGGTLLAVGDEGAVFLRDEPSSRVFDVIPIRGDKTSAKFDISERRLTRGPSSKRWPSVALTGGTNVPRSNKDRERAVVLAVFSRPYWKDDFLVDPELWAIDRTTEFYQETTSDE